MTLPVFPRDISFSPILPPMEAGTTTYLWALPPLVMVGLAFRSIAIQKGHIRYVWPILVVLSAALIALSTIKPTYHHYLEVTENLYSASRLKFLSFQLRVEVLWTFALVGLTLVGIKNRSFLSCIVVGGVASFYLTYPIVYTAYLGQGLLGPEVTETLLVALAFILCVELAPHVRRAKKYALFFSPVFFASLSAGLAIMVASTSEAARAFVTF